MTQPVWHDIVRVIVGKQRIILVLAKDKKARRKVNRLRGGHYHEKDLVGRLTRKDWTRMHRAKLSRKSVMIRDFFFSRKNRPALESEISEFFVPIEGSWVASVTSYITPLFNADMRRAKLPYRVLTDRTQRYDNARNKLCRIYRIRKT